MTRHTQAAMEIPEPYLGTQSSSLSIHTHITVLNTEDTFESYKLVLSLQQRHLIGGMQVVVPDGPLRSCTKGYGYLPYLRQRRMTSWYDSLTSGYILEERALAAPQCRTCYSVLHNTRSTYDSMILF